MYWVEETDEEEFVIPDDVVDLVFDIRCKALPVDHAYALSQAVRAALPWFEQEPVAGLHLIHGAESGNGWYRPEDGREMLYLSRRARLTLRLPKDRIDEASATLSGSRLEVAGQSLEVKDASVRKLSPMTSMYSRQVAGQHTEDEERFLAWAIDELKGLELKFKKVLSGRGVRFEMPDGPLETRSLLVAGLEMADAVRLQELGLGPYRKLGCGLFIPHKKV